MRERRERAETLIRVQQERSPHLHIGGLDVESEAASTHLVLNPANGQPLGRVPEANARDVEKAVEQARAAFTGTFRDTTSGERAQLLGKLASLIEAEADDLAILETLQTGRTFRDVLKRDVEGSIAALRYYAGWAGKHSGEAYELEKNVLALVQPEPTPVAAAILSHSEPLFATVRRLAPAIAAGSTLVVKPSEVTTLTVLRLAELTRDAGFPAGVFNVVPGGPSAGEALAMSPHVSVLSFAGSIETARRVLNASAKSNLKTVHLELGGKSANIVFDDADPKRVTRAVIQSIFGGLAPLNVAGSRLILQRTVYEEVSDMIASRSREVVIGDPLDEHSELGPLISEDRLKKVLAYVELGRREGAKLVAGGARDREGTRAHGYFMRPTVFVDARPSMRIAREEVGGPVLTILPFTKEEEAIAIANDSDYGMCAGVWTSHLGRAHRVARQLKAGVVWINGYGSTAPALPSGGHDLSGRGRDLGRYGLEVYTLPKSIYVDTR